MQVRNPAGRGMAAIGKGYRLTMYLPPRSELRLGVLVLGEMENMRLMIAFVQRKIGTRRT